MAIWMSLGEPKLVTWPNVVPLLTVVPMPLQLPWFRMLKKSERNSTLNRSCTWNCRLRATSKLTWLGPYRALRPRLPNWPLVCVQAAFEPAHKNAAGFKYSRGVFGEPYTEPGKITLGRPRPCVLSEISLPSVTWMGLPVNRLATGESCQSLVIALAKLGPTPGLVNTNDPLKFCRWSKPQLPRSPVARLRGFW